MQHMPANILIDISMGSSYGEDPSFQGPAEVSRHREPRPCPGNSAPVPVSPAPEPRGTLGRTRSGRSGRDG